MNRTAELKRTEFRRVAWKELKPAPGPRSKKCKCCRASFVPRSPLARACSPSCAVLLVADERKKQEAKADRARKQAMKTRQQWLKEVQQAFNAYIRERDKNKPCICCGRQSTSVDGLGAHGWDCGHYRSVGSAPHLRYEEDNAHRQLVYCNRNKSGNAVDYRIGLIARIGLARVEALESDNELRKWSTDDLKAMKALYKAKLKALKEN